MSSRKQVEHQQCMFDSVKLSPLPPGVLPYISHIGMCRPKGLGFLGRFRLKTGVDFAHFDLESGMVFKGTTGLYERIYWFNSK